MPFRRREFVTTAAAAGAHLLGASRARAAVNDRIRVAIIGLGGRGRDHMRDCDKISGVEVAAFCEPDETRMAQRASEFESLTGKKPALQQDLRRVLEDHNIDAVTIATCNAGMLSQPSGPARPANTCMSKSLCATTFSQVLKWLRHRGNTIAWCRVERSGGPAAMSEERFKHCKKARSAMFTWRAVYIIKSGIRWALNASEHVELGLVGRTGTDAALQSQSPSL